MMRFKGVLAHKFTESPVLELQLAGWRARFLMFVLFLGFCILVVYAFYLQILNNEFLQEKGESRYQRRIEISASRGKIFDRHGDLLAVSMPMKSVWAVPQEARFSDEQSQSLAKLLEMDPKELGRRLGRDKSFVFLQRQLPPHVGDEVAALKLPGIGQSKEYRRFYPNKEMAAHILGFTGIDEKGLEGVELAFEDALLGRPGSRNVIKDRRGQIVEDVGSIQSPQDGKDIYLALDAKIQHLAQEALQQAITDYKAKAGGVVVLDVRTGEILALANSPSYNPNNPNNSSKRDGVLGSDRRNRAITDTYEPGSVMKPFSIALALEKNKVRYDTPINCAPGRLTIGTATISDAHAYGVLSVAQVLQKSSNIGTAKIAALLSPKEMWEMFDSLGFGQAPQLGFPGEVGGRLRPWKNWRPIEQATMSYGHGISVSLIQMARAYTVFARDGELLPLSLTRVNGDLVRGRNIFSAETVREVRAMLEMAAQPGGTAPKARIPGYRVAGKTGTAYKVEDGRYAKKYVASFVGFAPVSNPRLVVAVMIDEPGGARYYGGDVAGPVFSRLMGGALRTLGVPHDIPIQVVEDNRGKGRL